MASNSTSWQVLVVESDRIFAASLALKYGLHGHYAQFAQSGTEARELISRFEPTLAILGTELPDLAGSELAKDIQARFPACSIVFMSDCRGARLQAKPALPGQYIPDVLIKSVHPETIYEEVSQIVRRDAS